MKRHFLLCAAPLLLAGACATTDNGNSGSIPAAQREYKTGSNIPKKSDDRGDAVIYDKESVERARDSALSQPQSRSNPGGR